MRKSREEIRKSKDQPRKPNTHIIDNPEREQRELRMEEIIKDKFPDMKDTVSRLKEPAEFLGKRMTEPHSHVTVIRLNIRSKYHTCY